jgi:hypothetical protein
MNTEVPGSVEVVSIGIGNDSFDHPDRMAARVPADGHVGSATAHLQDFRAM